MMRQLRVWTLALGLLCLGEILISPVSAGTFFIDAGVGAGQWTNATGFFSRATSNPGGLGYAANLSIGGYLFGSPSLNVSFAIKNYLSQNSNPGQEMILLIPTAILRLEFWRFFAGAGFSPLVFSRFASSQGLDAFALASGARMFVIEGGLIWKVLPDFHVNFEGSAQFVQSSAGLSPAPVIAGTLQFKFLFSLFGKGTRESSGDKFDGWRYPFGFGR